MLFEKIAELIGSMAGIEDGGEFSFGNGFQEVEQGGAVLLVKALGGFVEDKEAGHLDKCPGDQTKALFRIGKPAKRTAASLLQADHVQPVERPAFLLWSETIVNAYGIKEA